MTCTYLAKRLRELSSTKTGSYPHEFLCRTDCSACADYQPCELALNNNTPGIRLHGTEVGTKNAGVDEKSTQVMLCYSRIQSDGINPLVNLRIIGGTKSCTIFNLRIIGGTKSCTIFNLRIIGGTKSCTIFNLRIIGGTNNCTIFNL